MCPKDTQTLVARSLLVINWINVRGKAAQKSEHKQPEVANNSAGCGDKESSDTAEAGAAQMWDEKEGGKRISQT